jgi:hypothetical protein
METVTRGLISAQCRQSNLQVLILPGGPMLVSCLHRAQVRIAGVVVGGRSGCMIRRSRTAEIDSFMRRLIGLVTYPEHSLV